MLKKIFIITVTVIALLYGAFQGSKHWLKSVLPDKSHFVAIKKTQIRDLPYVTDNVPNYRGKILAVVTSVDTMGDQKATGYEHTELARAYFVFVANGFEVDIASPKGGEPPVVLDGDDMGAYDHAFLNVPDIQSKVKNSIPLAQINPEDYEAVYFVGGKGTMFDFPNNPDIKRITKSIYQNNKVVSAVCHGPAALVNVTLDSGEYLLQNKKVSSFTNNEELTLIPNAKTIFPFLLEDKLIEQGAEFQAGRNFLEQVSQDGKIITGQNPWSVWRMAEMVVAEIGYQPKPRIQTTEENSIELLQVYYSQGYHQAEEFLQAKPDVFNTITLLQSGMIAIMEWELLTAVDIFKLTNTVKNLTTS